MPAEDQLRPWLFELPVTERAALDAMSRSQVIAVAFDGCDLRLLPECLVEGTYGRSAIAPMEDRWRIRTEDELVRRGLRSPELLAALRADEEIRVHYVIAARLEATREEVGPTDLVGAGCQRATHWIAGMDMGAFGVEAVDARGSAGEPTVFDATAPVGPPEGPARRVVLSDGDVEECRQGSPGCGALVRADLVPIGSRPSRPPPAQGGPYPPSGGGPTFGTARLEPGFQPDPHVAPGVAGGPEDASRFGPGCKGWTSAAPGHLLVLESRMSPLRVLAESQIDLTLVVQGPAGVVCADDTVGTNPAVDGLSVPGTYQIWVGSYDPGASGDYLLSISARGSGAPPSGPPTPPPPEEGTASWRVGVQEPEVTEGVARLERSCAPGAVELPNARDDDCDGTADEGLGPSGSVEVLIAWEGPADVDLRVLDPRGNEVSKDIPRAPTGGRLSRDARGACAGAAPETTERIVWDAATPPFGLYEVQVGVGDACGSTSATSVVFSIAVGGRVLGEYRFSIAPGGPRTRVATFGAP